MDHYEAVGPLTSEQSRWYFARVSSAKKKLCRGRRPRHYPSAPAQAPRCLVHFAV